VPKKLRSTYQKSKQIERKKELFIDFFFKEQTRDLDVKVDIFDIEWLKKNPGELYQFLTDRNDDKLYNSLMINSILLKSDYTLEILPHFIFFCVQMILVICHHIYVLQSGYEQGWQFTLTAFTVLTILVQLAHEVI